ncbi:MAG: hypothetical protein KJO24_01065 [Gammaproteobacteria bacterium]|nr:hypothetical protein [Gammaproteobacteria bacterium]
MAGLRNHKTDASSAVPAEPMPEFIDELEELDSIASDDESSEQDEKLLFAKSTDVRRRIEERLEVRLLRDELGMDDLDIEE